MVAPLPQTGTRRYLARRTPSHLHRGIDLIAPEGTPVFATADGTVTHARAAFERGFSGYGGHVVIATGGRWLLHAHLSAVDVAPGERVRRGELLGRVGRTCFTEEDPKKLCAGAHLHFEVSPTPYPQRSEAPRLDPVAWLRNRAVHPFASAQPSSTPRHSMLPILAILALGVGAALVLRHGR
jgi:murein DD-endopeptidase MepM/ murein hydrolase activator NlpD